jgi:hypothetical protein
MKRPLLAVAVLCPMIAAAYACSTDTFTGGDASSVESGSPQSDFCSAEAVYVHGCFADAACQADLSNCGATFSALSPGFSAALTQCMQDTQLPCTTDISKILASACVSKALQSYTNDSGAFASLANDYCARCDKAEAGCADGFAATGPGQIASLFADPVVMNIDACEKLTDGGTVTTLDASYDCKDQAIICAIALANASLPASACTDR